MLGRPHEHHECQRCAPPMPGQHGAVIIHAWAAYYILAWALRLRIFKLAARARARAHALIL